MIKRLLSKYWLFIYNRIVMKTLNEDLKSGQFKQVYLLCGEEGYLKKQYKNRFVKAMLPEGDTMNYSYYEGKNTPVKEAIDLAETLPFFAEHRLIVFENTGFFKTAAGADLADYIKDMPETTCFIFVEEEIDKRNRLYKAVKAKGYIAELSTQDAGTLKRWVAGLVRKEQKQISESVIVYFLDKVGTDMENIQGELEKVFCYALERDTITKEDIDAVCVTQITNHIFEMVDAVAAGNQQKALDLYYELLALKEPPMRILFLLVRQYRMLFHVKALANQGYGRKEIASKAGLHPFVAGKNMEQAKRFKMGQLRRVMEEGAQLEQDVPEDKSAGAAAYIRAYCKAFRTFYDTLFGEGTAEQIFSGIPDHARRYTAVYGEFLTFVAKQAAQSQAESMQLKKKYLPKGGRR